MFSGHVTNGEEKLSLVATPTPPPPFVFPRGMAVHTLGYNRFAEEIGSGLVIDYESVFLVTSNADN